MSLATRITTCIYGKLPSLHLPPSTLSHLCLFPSSFFASFPLNDKLMNVVEKTLVKRQFIRFRPQPIT